MYVYHYHPLTSEFINAFPVRLDPLDQKPLIPRNATRIAPPTFEPGLMPCFIHGKWEQKEDHRGEIFYDLRTPKKIVELGPVPEHLKKNPEPVSHTEKVQLLRSKRNRQLAETDWMMLSDAPLSEDEKEKARIYRQALRDLPANTPDVEDIPWPALLINKNFRSLKKDQ